ncbi:MAG: hypothetical protein JNK02_12345 [Planctomycetes bacterium]|nr:hypothetical protein [Planctomycetota bacterium]
MNANVALVGLLALAAGIGGGVVGARLCASGPLEAAPAAVSPEPELGGALADLVARQVALERGLEELRLGLADVAAAQRRAISARDVRAETAPERAAPALAAGPAASGADAALERLLSGGLSWDEAQAAWQEVEKAGKLDALIAAIEERARARGNDPDAQTELGKAYLQKTFRAGGGPEAGLWASKADRAFDAALSIDDHHWESRFQKAVSLSFWPPMLGKQPDAVKQFETLIAQQEASGLVKPGYAETYLFLGNMHLQMGAKDKALAAWKQGAGLFPNHAELQKKLADVH